MLEETADGNVVDPHGRGQEKEPVEDLLPLFHLVKKTRKMDVAYPACYPEKSLFQPLGPRARLRIELTDLFGRQDPRLFADIGHVQLQLFLIAPRLRFDIHDVVPVEAG